MSTAALPHLTGLGHGAALARCTHLDRDVFAQQVWATRASLSRAADLPAPAEAFEDLFSIGSADRLLSEQALRTPFVRLAKAGTTLAPSTFTSPGGVGAGIGDQVDDTKVTAAFAGGATVVLQALHRTHPPLADFSRRLGAELGHPVQANAYITPPQSRGFSEHFDVHDVFVLQVSGCKRWRVHAPVFPAPLRDQPWTQCREAVSATAGRPADLDVVLEPGDALYLPRGWIHAATALGGISVHVTLGVHVWTRWHLVQQIVSGLARREDLRASLPVGVDVSDPVALSAEVAAVVECLRRALVGVDVPQMSAALGRDAAGAVRPEPVHPIAQARLARSPDPGQRLRWRRGLPASLDLPDGVLDAPDDPVLDRLRAGQCLTIAEMGVQRAAALLLAGVVVPA